MLSFTCFQVIVLKGKNHASLQHSSPAADLISTESPFRLHTLFCYLLPIFFYETFHNKPLKKSLSNFYSPVPFKRLMKYWQADFIAQREDQDYLALIPPFSFNLFFLKVTILSPRENCHFLFRHPLSTTAIILMWREDSLILRI